MKKHKRGFTLIEVSIFLAITGLLFLGVTIGVQNSIYQQRYRDAVESFADYLRNVYASVLNVQSNGTGRTGEAIYGKLLTFDESTRAGEVVNDDRGQVIYDYTIIGKAVPAVELQNGNTRELLNALEVNVLRKEKESDSGIEKYVPVGIIGEYTPKWGTRVQNKSSFNDFGGSIMIVRDPKSGTVRTYLYDGVIEVNEKLKNNSADLANLLGGKIADSNGFKPAEIDFCIDPDGTEPSNNRTNVRIIEGASNASGVEIVELDSNENECNRG